MWKLKLDHFIQHFKKTYFQLMWYNCDYVWKLILVERRISKFDNKKDILENMDSEVNNSSLENSRSGLTDTDGNLSSGAKHKVHCNSAEQSDDVENFINGISSDPSNPEQQLVVTPEMLYKLSKKIAQLTKVCHFNFFNFYYF